MGEIYKLSEIAPNTIIGGIYKINFPNGKCYIGLSNNIRRRMQDHNQEATRKDRMNLPLNNALVKYGLIEEFEILEIIDPNDRKKLAEREKYWIEYYHSNERGYGYNVTEGGEGTSIKGCANPKSSLNEDQFNQVIDLLKNSDKPMTEIANMFGVNHNTIININNGTSYFSKKLKYPIRSLEKTMEIRARSTNKAHAKINDEDAEYIKYMLEYTDIPMTEMAKEYEVDPTTILAINIGKTRFEKDRKYPIRDKERAKRIGAKSCNYGVLSQEQVDGIIRDLQSGKYSNDTIAKKYKVNINTVTDINMGHSSHCPKNLNYPLKKNSVPADRTKDPRYQKVESKMDEIINLLKNTNYSYTKIGEITGINRKMISKIDKGEHHRKDDLTYPIRRKD